MAYDKNTKKATSGLAGLMSRFKKAGKFKPFTKKSAPAKRK